MALTPPQGLEESDFETIEDAVLETARGRWFLREFARRARAADTGRLLEALGRIENLLSDREGPRSAPIIDGEQQARLLDERQERLSEIGWMLRERGYDGDICALIEKEARALARLAATVRGGFKIAEEASSTMQGIVQQVGQVRAIKRGGAVVEIEHAAVACQREGRAVDGRRGGA